MKRALIISFCFCGYLNSTSQSFYLGKIDEPTSKLERAQFCSLFDSLNVLTFHEVIITNESETLYELRSPNSEVRITKTDENIFSFRSTCAILYKGTWEKFEWAEHILTFSADSFELKSYRVGIHPVMTKEEVSEIIDKRFHMMKDSTFISKNWEQFKKEDIDAVLELACSLFIGAIGGSRNCEQAFKSIREDFDIMNAGFYSEVIHTNEMILELSKE